MFLYFNNFNDYKLNTLTRQKGNNNNNKKKIIDGYRNHRTVKTAFNVNTT